MNKNKHDLYFVYKITNIKNNKIYIGKTFDIKNRWGHHLSHLNAKNHQHLPLTRAINKYKKENFIIEQIEECETEEKAFERETYWILHFNSNNKNIGYNCTIGGEGSSGIIVSPETRAKILILLLKRVKK